MYDQIIHPISKTPFITEFPIRHLHQTRILTRFIDPNLSSAFSHIVSFQSKIKKVESFKLRSETGQKRTSYVYNMNAIPFYHCKPYRPPLEPPKSHQMTIQGLLPRTVVSTPPKRPKINILLIRQHHT